MDLALPAVDLNVDVVVDGGFDVDLDLNLVATFDGQSPGKHGDEDDHDDVNGPLNCACSRPSGAPR